jgi:hypothetical protein
MPAKTDTAYLEHLSKDKKLKPLLETLEPYELKKEKCLPEALCFHHEPAIIYQGGRSYFQTLPGTI